MSLLKEVAVETILHAATVAFFVLLAAGISHRLGANSCERHVDAYSAAAATPRSK